MEQGPARGRRPCDVTAGLYLWTRRATGEEVDDGASIVAGAGAPDLVEVRMQQLLQACPGAAAAGMVQLRLQRGQRRGQSAVRVTAAHPAQPSQAGSFFFTGTFFSSTYFGRPSRP